MLEHIYAATMALIENADEETKKCLSTPEIAEELELMKKFHGLNSMNCTFVKKAERDMTPTMIGDELCFTRTQFAEKMGVTPQRVQQFLRHGVRGVDLRRVFLNGKIYIPCTEANRKP